MSLLSEIQTNSKQLGEVAGLFIAAKNRKGQVQQFVEWLGSSERQATAAANFLKEIYLGNQTLRDVELAEQVVLSAFRHPVLGLGEWGDTEHGVAQSSQYRQIEAYWETPPEDLQSAP